MDYELKDNKLIIDNNLLQDKLFLFYLSKAILNLFTFEVDEPRILLNTNLNLSLVNNFCEIIILNENMNTFAYLTHFAEFDLGIFIEKSTTKINLNFISGSGHNLSKIKLSVIQKILIKYKKSKFLLKKIQKKLKKCKNSTIIYNIYKNSKINLKISIKQHYYLKKRTNRYMVKHQIDEKILNFQHCKQLEKLFDYIK